MNRFFWRALLATAAVSAAACSSSTGNGGSGGSTSPTLTLTVSPSSIPNDGSTANLVATVLTATGAPASGMVTITPNPGGVITYKGQSGNSLMATLGSDGSVDPVNGEGITYSCPVNGTQSGASMCQAGSKSITLSWQGNTTTAHITLTGATTSGTGSSGSTGGMGSTSSGGPTTGDSCTNPLNTITLFSPTPSITIGGSGPAATSVSLLVQYPDGTAASGCNVSFSEQPRENLLSLSANSVAVDATGLATVTATAGQTTGTAHLIASLGATATDGGVIDFVQPIQIAGQQVVPPTDGGAGSATIFVFSDSSAPSGAIFVAGGSPDSATIVFQVDSTNATQKTPAPNVPVAFAQAFTDTAPVSLSANTGVTDAFGQTSLTITAGSVPGVVHISASLVSNPAVTTTVVITINGQPNVPDAGQDLVGSLLTAAAVSPSTIVTQGACADGGLSCSATVTFNATNANGVPLTGTTVEFREVVGEGLITLGNTSGITDSNGNVEVVVNSEGTSGDAHVVATLAAETSVTAVAVVPIIGGAAIIELSSESPTPEMLLGIKGSGVQENGSMTFVVTDELGNPVPNVTVNFTEAQPALVTLGRSSALTSQAGLATVSFSSLSTLGITSITATVATGGSTAPSISESVAVRGAKPSASGFYFTCNQHELPVYDVDTQFSETTCTVRLSDRFGNRVGIPTPVNFATESGSITASVLTSAFNPATPDTEGEATVTFSTDFGAGGGPADVVPLAAYTGGLVARDPEPSRPPEATFANIELNPRDQFVTIIAMTQGEEGFIASGAGGGANDQYQLGDIFFDLGSPYIDANDDNVYDQVRPGGEYEKFFCSIASAVDGGVCPGYEPPNGVWDANTTIWTETWVVFTGAGTVFDDPATSWQNETLTNPNTGFTKCSISGGVVNGIQPGESDGVNFFAYDDFLNPVAPNTGFGNLFSTNTNPASLANSGVLGSGDVEDGYGAMNFNYSPVAESDGGECSTANGAACVNAISFGTWGTGYVGTGTITNSSAFPSCTSPAVAEASCGTTDLSYTTSNSLQSSGPATGLVVTSSADFQSGIVSVTCVTP